MPESNKKNTTQVLINAEQVLFLAQNGLEDVKSTEPKKRKGGIYNVATWGRSVTNVLQNLRSTEILFDEWYKPYQEEMKNDSLLRFFYKLRSEVLKEGNVKLSRSAKVNSFNLPVDFQRIERPHIEPPLELCGFIIGDEIGGNCWEIKLPDGSIQKYYIALPSDIGESQINFNTPPTSHLGKDCRSSSIYELCHMYVEYMANLVKDAKSKFSS